MTTDAGTPTPPPMPLRKAMERAFNLGQTYWQQADHEFTSHHRKADVTMQTFRDLASATCAQHDGALTAAEAERDKLRQRDAEWQEKAAAWMASPEAAKRLAGYREMADKCAALDSALDAARSENVALRARVAGLEEALIDAIDEADQLYGQWRGGERSPNLDEARALLAPPPSSSEETK